jgi:hypothetical protein
MTDCASTETQAALTNWSDGAAVQTEVTGPYVKWSSHAKSPVESTATEDLSITLAGLLLVASDVEA